MLTIQFLYREDCDLKVRYVQILLSQHCFLQLKKLFSIVYFNFLNHHWIEVDIYSSWRYSFIALDFRILWDLLGRLMAALVMFAGVCLVVEVNYIFSSVFTFCLWNYFQDCLYSLVYWVCLDMPSCTIVAPRQWSTSVNCSSAGCHLWANVFSHALFVVMVCPIPSLWAVVV